MKTPRPLPPETIPLKAPLRGLQSEFLGKALFTASELESVTQARFSEGWEEGQKNLRAQLVQQRMELMELQKGLFVSLRRAVDQVVTQTESTVCELVVTYVRKIVGQSAITAESVQEIVSDALQGVARETVLQVRLHPEDYRLLQELRQETASDEFEIVSDDTLKRGDCLVQTKFGAVDARRETKLASVQKEMGWR
jgi:flagellar assembly protein FliH